MSNFDAVALLASSGVTNLRWLVKPSNIEEALRRLATLMQGLDELQSEIVRCKAIEHLKNMDIVQPGRLIDAALRVHRRSTANETS